MRSITEPAMQAYYNRDPLALRRLLEQAEAEAAHLRAYIAGHPTVGAPTVERDPTVAAAGPSSAPPDTGRNERSRGLFHGSPKGVVW